MYRTKQKAAAISAEAEGIYQELKEEAKERQAKQAIVNSPFVKPSNKEIIPALSKIQKTAPFYQLPKIKIPAKTTSSNISKLITRLLIAV